MNSRYPRVLPCGDSAVTVEFGDAIDETTSEKVIAFDLAVRRAKFPGVIECVPTYRSLLVHLDPVGAEHSKLYAALQRLARKTDPIRGSGRRWRVPVVYGGLFGKDLDALAGFHGMSPKQAVQLHSASIYRVYMVGFMPGFTYLGGLDPRLATPRLKTPRTSVPGGSISIGGAQSAIGSTPSPSGWHLIGSTPVRCFHPDRDPIFLFEAGDEVEFEPAAAEDWEKLERHFGSGHALPRCEYP